MSKILKVFSRILDVIMADGSKRLKLAIENIIFMAFAVVCAWGADRLVGYVSENLSLANGCSSQTAGYTVLAMIGIVICLATGIYTLIAGVISQVVLLVFAFLGALISRSRIKNFLAFLIALVSVSVVAFVCLYLYGLIRL